MRSPLSPPPSAPPTGRWRVRGAGRRAGILALSLALGLLSCAATGVARGEPGTSGLFTPRNLRRVGPAVVRIDGVTIEPIGGRPFPSTSITPERQKSDPFFPDPFFQQFFNPQPHQKKLGAGVVFTEEGLILTTARTVERMDYHLDVHFTEGRTLPGKLVGVDFVADLAVAKVVAPPPFPTAPLGDSDALEVGDWIVAVGKHPSGTDNTVATGVISRLNHHQGAPDQQLETIRTDAAVDHNNAGGPLVNVAGRVVGINTLARSGEPADHQGFAVPINTARAVAEELIRTGLRHPTVGVRLWSLTPALAQEFNQSPDNTGFQLPERQGVLIVDVRSRSPAEHAGLRAGDVVLTAAGSKVASPVELFRAVASTGAGGPLQLGIWRQCRQQQVTVIPEEMAEQVRRAMRSTVTPLPSPSLP
ncbi:MAG: PDZ domain-containing protein [Synechococcus sp. SB0666_bin_14]|nr:PDZ domain-containing protein [Synechococcus sp. SB0666_bin_14]MYG46082.1 PDZ domain-containing protein [Synechococcus sp. SB0675_bin_6]MYJ60160.1 PDZ domain-containing protein [Synechococcus sp. SB0672_bin_6]MYK91840.1 PDZ domain-containing protein [Synechococcus sp. SB0669_bin_8]